MVRGDGLGGDLDALLAGLEQQIRAEEKSPRAFLRSRPTWIRIALATVAVLLVVGPVVLFMPRRDLHEYPGPRMILTVLAMIISLAITVIIALRPAYRPPLPRALLTAATVSALLILFFFSMMPMSGTTTENIDSFLQLLPHALPCFYFGVAAGAPIYLIVRTLDHQVTRLTALLAAGTAGLTANLALHFHCANSQVEHMLLGHFSVAVLFMLLVAAAGAISRRAEK
jgi:hypothetical protein